MGVGVRVCVRMCACVVVVKVLILTQPPHVNSYRLFVIHILCGYNNGAQHSDVITTEIPQRPRSVPPPPSRVRFRPLSGKRTFQCVVCVRFVCFDMQCISHPWRVI